jgi:adenylate cyclase
VPINPIPSAGLRFFRKSGVAIFWVLVFGLLLGGLAFVRLDRRELEPELRWHVWIRLQLERLEWASFDWRARELGGAGERAEGVVLVAVDEETVVNARESEHPEWAMNPWPRDLLGAVAEQAVREGASLVVIDAALSDASPHLCAGCRGEPRRSDDELLAARLERLGKQVVLGFDWQPDPRRPPDRALSPYLVRVGDFEDLGAALPAARRILARRATAYLVPGEGRRVLWAGAPTEVRARELATALELKGPPTQRSLTPADDAFELTRSMLSAELAQVRATGVDPERLPRAAALDGPVATLLIPGLAMGSMRLTPDADGVVRALPLLVAGGDPASPVLASAALRAVLQLAGSSEVSLEGRRLVAGGRFTVPVDAQGYQTLRWNAEEAGRGARGTLRRALPAWRLLVNREDDDLGRGLRHHDNGLTGKVVVLTDLRQGGGAGIITPVGPLGRGAILAQAISNLLAGDGIGRAAPEADLWLTATFALVGGVLAVAWSSLVRRPGWLAWVATLGGVSGLHLLIARQIFVTQERWVAVVAPLLAFSFTFLASLGYARTLEQRLREFMLRALGGAVRADVFQRVDRDLALMRPERRELVIYFGDIEGFTAVAQSQEPKLVVSVLQAYLGEMTTEILDREGHVDKYLGDGLMAFWGAPVALADAAAVACSAALAMQARFEARRAGWEARLGRPLVLRASLEAGPTLVGEMGTSHRVNYTVMGEPVATAFRLEGLAKSYDAHILVGPGIVGAAGARFVFRDVDLLRHQRSGAPQAVSELLGRAEDLIAEAPWLERYREAMARYRARDFAAALAGFEALATEKPQDRLVARYVARCRHSLAEPPGPDWDGVFTGREA